MMRVKTKKVDPKAVLPYKTYKRDFCYDVVATSCDEIAPNIYSYRIGLAFELVREDIEEEYFDDVLFSLDFRPRSSIWKTGMILSNCIGTIDELFRGEVSAVFYHIMPNMPKYEVGDRIGQIKLGATERLEFIEVDELNESERGNGSYGSTGR